MPYIDKKRADRLTSGLGVALTPGDLNFMFSTLAAEYIEAKGLSYQTINDISGAMTEALAEFRRRIVVPYEDQKRRTGADPYVEVRPVRSGGIPIIEKPDDNWIERVGATRKDEV